MIQGRVDIRGASHWSRPLPTTPEATRDEYCSSEPLAHAPVGLDRMALGDLYCPITRQVIRLKPRPDVGEGLSQKRIRVILANPDLVLKNLEITQYYNEVATRLRDLIGADGGVNWCGWACWASKHVGHTIRMEDVPILRRCVDTAHRVLESMLPASVSTALWGGRKVLHRCSERVSEANASIFERTCPHFTRFIEMFSGDTQRDDAKFQRFLGEFTPGPALQGGHQLMIDGFTSYYDAMWEKDSKKKAELVLLGNIQIVWDEQIHADKDINRAIPWYAGWAVTQTALELVTPTEQIKLGDDLTPRPDGRIYPESLETLENPDLVKLVRMHTRSKEGTTRGTAARDYRWIADRMNLIVNVFRTRHDDQSLFRPPFDPEQTADIRAGYRPDGPL